MRKTTFFRNVPNAGLNGKKQTDDLQMAEFIYLNAGICFVSLHWSVSGSASREAMRIAREDGSVFHQPFLSASTLDSLIFSPFLN